MENCLLTTLQSSVDNESLKRLGEFEVLPYYDESAKEYLLVIRLQTNVPTYLRIVGSGFFHNNAREYVVGASQYESINVTNCDETTKVFVQNKDYYLDKFLLVKNTINLDVFKYRNIAEITPYGDDHLVKGDISAFSDDSIISTLILSRNSGKDEVFGDLASLANCTSLRTLDIRNQPNITGELSSIGHLSLTNLNVWAATKLTGSIESYVAKRRISDPIGTMTFSCYSNLITWKGLAAHGTNPVSGQLSWTNDTITWEGDTIVA